MKLLTGKANLQARLSTVGSKPEDLQDANAVGTERQIERQSIPFFVAEPTHGWISLRLWELWEYRELLYFLVWRDVKVRYKQTVLGILWAGLQPFVTMVIFSLFFGNWGRIPSDGIPYPIFTYAALLPWQLFSGAVALSSNSLVINQELITRVYFLRLLAPISAVFAGLVDFMISFVILLGLMAYYGIKLTTAVVLVPLFVLLAMVAALAIGLWLAALNVQYRDVQYTIPFLIHVGLFITPIAYPSSMVPKQWHILYGLNPMVGVVEGFRWALLGQATLLDISFGVSVLMTLILFAGGLAYFRRMERTFADIV